MRSSVQLGTALALVAVGASCAGSVDYDRGGGSGRGGAQVVPAAGATGGVPTPTEGGAGGFTAGTGAPDESPGAAGVGDGGDILADPKRDILDTTLEIDVATGRSKATITVAPSASQAVTFEIGNLRIESVTVAGKAVRWSAHRSALDIEVPPTTEPLVVTIEYRWEWQSGLEGVNRDGYTFTWPYYCGNVFPCHSDPADGTKFHLQLRGVERGTTILYPNAIETDAPAFAAAWIMGKYTELPLGVTRSGTRVSTWYLPGGEADARAGTAHLLASFEWFEDHLGPYRFGSHVGSAAAPWRDDAYAGMEHHPVWHVAVGSMSKEKTQVHEAAHGWFGNGVRLRCWEDIVLSEGTVAYLTARALEEVAGTSVSDPIWTTYERQLDALRVPGANEQAWPQSCGVIDILSAYSVSPYVKGAFFYRALELKIGRGVIDEALAAFYARHAGEATGMQDMLDVIAEVSDYDPTDCATAWLVDAKSIPVVGACP